MIDEMSVKLDNKQRKFMKSLPRDGSTIGNYRLRELLGFESESYWAVHDSLSNLGLIVRGRGYGGSVARVPEDVDVPASEEAEPARSEDDSTILSGLAQALLEKLPGDGEPVGNVRLARTLEVNEQDLRVAGDELVALGLARRGKGGHGTLARVPQQSGAGEMGARVQAGENAKVVPERTREDTLYEPLRLTLESAWLKANGWDALGVEVTGKGGSRQTGGTWSRPDLTAVEVKNLEYYPTKILEVITFEVKPSDSISVEAVYEAVQQRRKSTRAFVLLYTPGDESEWERYQGAVDQVVDAARSQGIGVVTFADPNDADTWTMVLPAERVEPDPSLVDDFLRRQISKDLQKELRLRLK